MEAWVRGRGPAEKGDDDDADDGGPRAKVDILRQRIVEAILPTQLWAERTPFSRGFSPHPETSTAKVDCERRDYGIADLFITLEQTIMVQRQLRKR